MNRTCPGLTSGANKILSESQRKPLEAFDGTHTLGCIGRDRRPQGSSGSTIFVAGRARISIAAMLAGANDLIAICRWGRRLKLEALQLFGITTGKAPCHATCHYFFRSLDAEALSRTLGAFALDQGRAEHIASDGKTLKGRRRLDDKAVHVLSAFATELGSVIGDLTIALDQNEITAAMVLLKALPLDGRIITGDSIFTQREICRYSRDSNGHYVFTVKDNQPALKAGIAEAFGDLSPLRPPVLSRRALLRRPAA